MKRFMKIQNTVNYVHYNQEVKYLCDTFSDLFDAHQKLLMHSLQLNEGLYDSFYLLCNQVSISADISFPDVFVFLLIWKL